ncbi:MAG: UDP-N-acetylmuramate dehydrogenase [Acidobacteria bacterium]|nr:UDP-N-acetylmuramate dehydrogenase [Acidobacteriota bacterium]
MLLATAESQADWSRAAVDDLARWATDVDVRAKREERLKRHTSFGVGGPCPLMLFPEHHQRVVEIVRWSAQRQLPLRILGGGTNLLVRDEGIREVVVNTTRLLSGIDESVGRIRFPAGTATARALHHTVESGRDGLVWASGLPGTLGGAAAGNAGCWGGDMASCTESMIVIDANGGVHDLGKSDLDWTYRNLNVRGVVSPWIIVAVSISTTDSDPGALRARYEDLQEQKRDRQPVGARNSGCIFRNPPGQAAGAILDAAGCKGLRVGGAVVSDRHANFVINDGSATAADISALIEALIIRAREAVDVELLAEVQRW